MAKKTVRVFLLSRRVALAVGAVLGSWLLDQPFTFRRFWADGPWLPRGTEAVTAAGLLLVSFLLCALTCLRQRKRELL